jgi:hypothetical protein
VNEDESIIVLVPVVDDLMMSDELLFSITANPASLIGENDVTLKPVEGGVQLQVHARPDQHGLGSITLVVDDTIHQVSGEIPVQVVPVADPPRIQPVADRTVVGNQPFEVEIQLSDPDSPLTDMQLLLESNYPELLPVDNALIAIAGSPTILSFTPSPGRFGIVEITVRVQALDGLSTEEAFQVQVTDPAREETPPVNLRLVRTNNGAPETLYLSWIGEMDVYVADQLLGPYRLLEGVSSPFQPAVEPDGKFYKLVPRSRP